MLTEMDKDRPVDLTLGQHEAPAAAGAHCRDHIHRTPLARTSHHGRFAPNAPGRSRMAIGSHARFVAEIDLRPRVPGLVANRRILLLQPLPHSFRILLRRTEQRTLTGKPQLLQ
jgi:hypothetical protein